MKTNEMKKRAAKLVSTATLETVKDLPRYLGLAEVALPKIEIGETVLIRVDPDKGDKRWLVAVFAYDGRFYDSPRDKGDSPSYSIVEVKELYRLPEVKR